jgi:hypothetical protein
MKSNASDLIDTFAVKQKDIKPHDITIQCPYKSGGASPSLTLTFTAITIASLPDHHTKYCTLTSETTGKSKDYLPITPHPPHLSANQDGFTIGPSGQDTYTLMATGDAGGTYKTPHLVVVSTGGKDPCLGALIKADDSDDSGASVQFERFEFSGIRPVDRRGNPMPLGFFGMVPAAFTVGGSFPRPAETKEPIPVTRLVLVNRAGGDPIQPSEFRSPEPGSRDRWSAAFTGVLEGTFDIRVTLGDDPNPAPESLVLIIAATPPVENSPKK